MYVVFFSYLIAISVIFVFFRVKNFRYKAFPKLHINRNGIYFFSNSCHRIFIGNATTLILGKVVYLKQNGRNVVINNIYNVKIFKQYIYFKSSGRCEIWFPCSRMHKYFNIKITSKLIDVQSYQVKALNAMLNNLFNLNKVKEVKRYLKIVIEVFKIRISKKQIVVKQNLFNMPYVLEYVANNVYKKINVNI